MSKVTKPLTELEIKKAEPGIKKDKKSGKKIKVDDYTLADGRGLHILIKLNGRKVWEFVYKSPTKQKRRKTTFGSYPEVSLKQAREKASKYRELIFKGIDPIDYFKEKKEESKLKDKGSLEKVFNKWIEEQKDNLAKSTYRKKKALIERVVISKFPNRSIQSIEHPEIVTILKEYSKNTPESARRLYTYLDNLWRYAIMEGYCKINIIANIHKSILQKVVKKSYPKITDPVILKELVNAIYSYHGHPSTKNALKFVLHIPLRAGNLVTLKWDYIDFEKKLLTIPRNEMKNKDENLPDFTMPLSDEVIKILKEQQTFTGNRKYIFVSDNGVHINPETTNRALQRMGFNYNDRKQRTHSFRGTFRSLCDTYRKEHKAEFEVKEIALDHRVGNQVTQAYSNKADYLSQLRELMEWWSGFVVEMLD